MFKNYKKERFMWRTHVQLQFINCEKNSWKKKKRDFKNDEGEIEYPF